MGWLTIPILPDVRLKQVARVLKFYTSGEFPHAWEVLDFDPDGRRPTSRMRSTKWGFHGNGPRRLLHCVARMCEYDVLVAEGYMQAGFRVTDKGREHAIGLFGKHHSLSAQLEANLPFQLIGELKRHPEAVEAIEVFGG